MKLSHIFAVVVALHLAVVGTLLVTPGCQGVGERIRPQGDLAEEASPFGKPPHEQESGQNMAEYHAPEASPESSAPLLPPTKPTWNISGQDSPEVIEGEVVYEETQLNVINPDLNEMEAIEVDEVVVTDLATSETYTVQKGDNLTKIAKAKGVNLGDLMTANGLKKDSIINIGQVLIIPSDSLAGPVQPVSTSYSPATIDEEGTVYVVKRGDTLGAIAKRYGTSVSSIRGANGLSGDIIQVGQELLIPAGGASVPTPPPVQPKPVTTRTGETTYVVKSGDTLGAIAKRYDVTVRDLAARNSISDPRKLRAGQTLIVPGEGNTLAPAPSTAPKTAPQPVQPGLAPVPAPTAPVVETETETIDEFYYENLDDVPVVPVQTSDE